ncbi:MAG: MerR family transcriptional regulator [Bacteroidota bacterium]|nr:MerR family transcriptional regulator [Bacteroidota bacterium]
MNQFTIKDIENLSGIKAHTWRMWEQRYGIGMPQRKDSNHRFYDNENLKQILRISYLYHSGVKVSRIASLNADEIRLKALEALPIENGNEYYIKELLEASIDLDEERFEGTFDNASNRLGVENAIINIIYPFQDKIGVLWLTDHVIPAQEHFTSNIIRRKLSVATDHLPQIKETSKKEILLFTPEKEHHELPLQFICYLLKKNKNKVIFFGSNVSLESIDTYQRNKPVKYLLFHLVTNLTNKHAQDYVNKISRLFPEKIIYMSGALVSQVHHLPPNVHLLKSMNDIVRFATE